MLSHIDEAALMPGFEDMRFEALPAPRSRIGISFLPGA
jgi:hypothetical protein